MSNKIELKTPNVDRIRKIFFNLIQHAIKKGNKNKIENIFKKMLFDMKITSFSNNNFYFNSILKAVENITPIVGIKTKRKGSKNIYIPFPLTESRSNFLSSNWLIQNSLLKQNKSFHKNLIEELSETANKKSNSFKKYYDLQKLAETSSINVKYKLKNTTVSKKLIKK